MEDSNQKRWTNCRSELELFNYFDNIAVGDYVSNNNPCGINA